MLGALMASEMFQELALGKTHLSGYSGVDVVIWRGLDLPIQCWHDVSRVMLLDQG